MSTTNTYTFNLTNSTVGHYDTGIVLGSKEYVTSINKYFSSITVQNISLNGFRVRWYAVSSNTATSGCDLGSVQNSTSQPGTSSNYTNMDYTYNYSGTSTLRGKHIYLYVKEDQNNGAAGSVLVNGTIRFTFTTVDTETYYDANITNGSGSGVYVAGDSVEIVADSPPSGKIFSSWTGTTGLTFTSGGYNTATAIFTMPSGNVSLIATYENITRSVAVSGGSGSGTYDIGDLVEVIADSPPSGKLFNEWTGASGLTFVNGSQNTPYITFRMPSNDVALTATYKNRSSVPQAGRYDGSNYQQVIPMYYDGTNWVECEAQYYNGTNWTAIDAQ